MSVTFRESLEKSVHGFGVVWGKDKQCFAVTRKLPEGKAKTDNNMCFITGSNPGTILPDSGSSMPASANRNEVNRLIEAQFGIGEVKGETLGTGREGKRISVRQVTPLILQDDDVIISKTTLLRGMNGDGRRQIIDSIPYFFGISDEKDAANVAKLRRLRGDLNKLEAKEKQRAAILSSETDRGFALLAEAVNLGLLDKPEDLSPNKIRQMLASVSSWQPGQRTTTGQDDLAGLYELEQLLFRELRTARQNLKAARVVQSEIEEFDNTSDSQRKRLKSIGLFQTPTDEKDLSSLQQYFASRTFLLGCDTRRY